MSQNVPKMSQNVKELKEFHGFSGQEKGYQTRFQQNDNFLSQNYLYFFFFLSVSNISRIYTSTSAMFLFTIVGSSHSFQTILFVTFLAIDTIQASINKTTNPNGVTNFELSHLKRLMSKSFLKTNFLQSWKKILKKNFLKKFKIFFFFF